MIVAIVALLVFGPDGIPEAARQAGHVMPIARDARASISKELRGVLEGVSGTRTASS